MLIDKVRMVEVGSAFCSSLQPDTQRLVILQQPLTLIDEVITHGARYRNGKWYDETTNYPVPVSKSAVWSESLLPDASSLALVENDPLPMPKSHPVAA